MKKKTMIIIGVLLFILNVAVEIVKGPECAGGEVFLTFGILIALAAYADMRRDHEEE